PARAELVRRAASPAAPAVVGIGRGRDTSVAADDLAGGVAEALTGGAVGSRRADVPALPAVRRARGEIDADVGGWADDAGRRAGPGADAGNAVGRRGEASDSAAPAVLGIGAAVHAGGPAQRGPGSAAPGLAIATDARQAAATNPAAVAAMLGVTSEVDAGVA